MDVKPRFDLRTEVESVAGRLNGVLLRVFQECFASTPREPAPREAAAPGEWSPPERLRAAALALERFWSSALDAPRCLPGGAEQPEALLRRLHRRWVELIRPQAGACFAPHLRDGPLPFTGLLVLDRSRLEGIARSLKLGSEEGPLCLPGRISALHDVPRGLVVRLWVERDGEGPSPPSPEEIGSCLRPGEALIGEAGPDSPRLFEAVAKAGAHALLRIGNHSGLRFCPLGRAALQEGGNGKGGSLIQDEEVELEGAAGPCRVRRVALVEEDKVFAVLTDVLDRLDLPARLALRLAAPRWRLERLFTDLRGAVDLEPFGSTGAGLCEAQAFAAAILSSALRVAQGWIAEARSLPAAALAREFLFPRLVQACALQASRVAHLQGSPRPPEDRRDPPPPGAGGIVTGDLVPPMFWEEAETPLGGEGVDLVAPLDPPGGAPAGSRRLPPRPAGREEMLAIGGSELDAAFEPFCRAYAEVGHRDGFLWKWVQRGIELTTLPCVDPPWRDSNRTVKLLGVMLDVLLDDVADNLKDGEFLSALLKVPFNPSPLPPAGLGEARARYHSFTAEVWLEISRLAASFPRYAELREVFEFDYRQLLNTMRYAFLVNRLPEILNLTEHDLYQPHNMHMMISGTLDLMCSERFDRRDLAPIRQALWRGQVMGRIGNMVSTWEREIKERDFTSGVFAAAIERGVVKACDLPIMPPAALTRAIEESGVIEGFLRHWERLRDEVYRIAERVRSVDLLPYAAGLEELIRNHLGSRGLK